MKWQPLQPTFDALHSLQIHPHWPQMGRITSGPLHEGPWWLVAWLCWPGPQCRCMRDCWRWFWNCHKHPFPAWAWQGTRYLLCHALQCRHPLCRRDGLLLLFVSPPCLCSQQFSGQYPGSWDGWWRWWLCWWLHHTHPEKDSTKNVAQIINSYWQ